MKKKYHNFLNQPPKLCLFYTHACTQTNTHTDAHAGPPQQRRWREETDRGKPLERQITGLDKLHFNCDHESRLDVRLVFSQLTTAAIELWSTDDKMVVFQNNVCWNFAGIIAWVD